MAVPVTPAVEAAGWNDAPATKDAKDGAPNGLVCAIGGASDGVGSDERPSAALALGPVGADAEAELEARATGAGVVVSGFWPPCAASCEAARAMLGRSGEAAGEAVSGEAVGGGAVVFATDGTVSAKGCADATSAREKAATESISPLISGPVVGLAIAGANGASAASARLAGAEARLETPRWKARSPVRRPTVAASAAAATGAPPLSDLGVFIAGEANEGESSASRGRSFIIAAAREANGNDAMSALSLGRRW
jgi:hypothetical protein